jgi:hypothetical protein
VPTNLVNLDSLIRREDFEIIDNSAPSQKTQTIQIRDLERGAFFYEALRKPDFQRETANWSPSKNCDFVASFLNGDLIPAIILWQAGGGSVFVIDGAHRLSALIAWVQDDYGDGKASRDFFENLIPEDQIKAAQKTRKLIDSGLGSYQEHLTAVQHPDKSKAAVVARAKRLGSLAVQVQWVTGNADKAEDSFFKINQEAIPIDPTEFRILKSRNNPNALAARAIVRSGTGHKYWSRFSQPVQEEIESLADEIHSNLFRPPLQTPIKTLDLPVAGKGYSAQTLPLIFDFVNLVNDVVSGKAISRDETGEETIRYLKNVRKIAYRISGTHPSSLGLHPAVYFYSSTGRYQPTSFLAVVGFAKELDSKRRFVEFTKHRRDFEEFLMRHKDFSNQLVRKLGSGLRGFSRLVELYRYVLDSLVAHKSSSDIVSGLEKDQRFSFLKADQPDDVAAEQRDFKSETKSAAFLKDALENPLRCKICHGLIHTNSISIDHIERKQDGGTGALDNAQLTHPFCNTSYKN